MNHRLLSFVLALLAACQVHAAQVIETPEAFVASAFTGATPSQAVLWLTPDIQSGISRIVGQRLPNLRQRYWRSGQRSAWILEKVGKEEPITAGFVVEDGRIVSAHVLIYRETRGWEIRYPNFRDQFIGLSLDQDLALNGRFDGIAGATLSVNAMRSMARLALYLHSAAMSNKP
jgi:hypothetical protein